MMDSTESFYQTLSIASPGETTLPRIEKKSFAARDPNNIQDIDGAQSAPRYRLFFNKPQFLNTDIEGAAPKQHARSRNVRDNTLYVDDIEGTRHTIKDRMMRTRRSVNPLAPQYDLPSFAPVDPPTVKYIKDPLAVQDIEGCKPKVKKVYSTRNPLNVDDIVGARSGYKQRPISSQRDILSTSDITAKRIPTTRITDPNRPKYIFHGLEIEDDKLSKPREPKKFIADNFQLKTKDINFGETEGGQSDRFPRKEVKNTNFIRDIDGAQADSVKHSIVTTRNTNPLQPIYQSLDDGKELLPLIPPLIPEQLIKFPQMKRRESRNATASEIFKLSGSQHNTAEVSHSTPNETQYISSARNSTNKFKSSQQAEIDLVRSLP